MITVWMLLFSLSSLSVFSAEFNHIKLSPQFEQYLTSPKLKIIPSLNAKSISNGAQRTEKSNIEEKLRSSLLGMSSKRSLSTLMTSKKDWTNPIPVDGEESLLYEEIRNFLDPAHREIALGQIQQLNILNSRFGGGEKNYSGFGWQRPFGAVQIYADRQVTPNLFGQNWLIADTFTFEIEAATFLEKLTESGLAEMNATEIAAFAGFTFKRVFTYYHYANSYQEGLSSDFSKLFLPFVFFNQRGMENMGNEEIMKREDLWSARAGGLISTPSSSGISFSGGALAEYSYQQTTSVQSTPTEANQRYQLNVISKKSTEIGVTLGLQLDFFKLIQLSLLRYDLNYEYASGKEFTLAVNSNQWEQVKQNQNQGDEWKKILRGFGQIRHLEPYVVRLDESTSSDLQRRGSVLIFGKLQKSKTEQIRVIKDQVVRIFFKNYAQSVKVVQNIFSRIFSAIVYKVLKLPIGSSNAALYSRNLNIEYEATHPQANDPSITRLDSTEQFSFVLSQNYEAAKTHRWIDRKFKNDVIWFIDNYTTLPKDYKGIVRSEQLRGPLRVESTLRVEKNGFEYLLNSPENDIFSHIAKVCDSAIPEQWSSESRRKKLLKRFQLGAESCVKKMGQKYLHMKEDYLANALKPSLVKFKDFMTSYYKKADGLADLTALFGNDNTFIHGRFQAKTSQGGHFVTTFSSGQFRGMGVIDNFKRSMGSRAPASIVNE